MRTLITMSAVVLAVSLAGCASNASKVQAYQTEPVGDANVDWAYVAKVDKQAARNGVKVYWMSMPHKRGRASNG